ncbi:MAG: hypothetical protein HY958_10125 [Bacteroidia bacterium]|nr:hypothetical protein [Bacteroidia bacterium]
MLQPKLLKTVIDVLDKNSIDYMITGSLVSSLQGEPRATHDIDIVINIQVQSVSLLLNAFPAPDFYLSENSIREAIKQKSMFNLLDTTEGDKVDFWLLTDSPFDLSRFKRKYTEKIIGLEIKISSPEDTILAKLLWAKLSGGSEKQFTDALRVYEVQYEKMEHSYIEDWVARLQLNELWIKLKDEAKPIL